MIEAEDGDQALDLLATHGPCLVLLDQVMRGKQGMETAREMLERDPEARIVMFTAVSDPTTRAEALRTGILRVVEKANWMGLEDVLVEQRG